MKLSEMRDVLTQRDIQLTKSLGQNFLHDANQLQKIVDAAELSKADKVLEIGPGLGPLTELLLEKAGEVLAIEMDLRLVEVLRERFVSTKNLNLLHDDALEFLRREPRDWSDWKLVANLPYSVASPILVELAQSPRRPERMVTTLQLEVAQRLMAQADDDDYGILTLLVQLDFEPRGSFKIPPECFFPSPDVDSACVCLVRRATPLLPENLRARFCENRQARLLATAQDDAEIVETGLGGGQTGGRLCRIINLAAGTCGEIKLGAIRGADGNFKQSFMKHVVVEHHLPLLYQALKWNKATWDKFNSEIEATNSDITVQKAQLHIVIILLANSMIEALANFYLANKCDEEQFAALERLSTLEKLVVVPKLFLKEYEFPKNGKLYSELKALLALRTSVVHAKPRIIVNGQTIHKGNLAKKVLTSTVSPDKCVSLPVRLVEHLCLYDHGAAFELCIYCGFSDADRNRIISKVQAKSLKQRATK